MKDTRRHLDELSKLPLGKKLEAIDKQMNELDILSKKDLSMGDRLFLNASIFALKELRKMVEEQIKIRLDAFNLSLN